MVALMVSMVFPIVVVGKVVDIACVGGEVDVVEI